MTGVENLETEKYASLINLTLNELIVLHKSTQYQSSTSEMEYIINKTKNIGVETYIQEFPVYTGSRLVVKGQKVYSYIRAKGTTQKECLLIAYRYGINQYNMAYHLGVSNEYASKTARYIELATVITLMEQLKISNWLSRDVVFLGYNGDYQYGTGVRNFLKEIGRAHV